jgi:hypothetical protein
VIASAIGHIKASTTELYQHVNGALQYEGFAHLGELAPKPEPEPDGDGPLAEVVDLSAPRRLSAQAIAPCGESWGLFCCLVAVAGQRAKRAEPGVSPSRSTGPGCRRKQPTDE